MLSCHLEKRQGSEIISMRMLVQNNSSTSSSAFRIINMSQSFRLQPGGCQAEGKETVQGAGHWEALCWWIGAAEEAGEPNAWVSPGIRAGRRGQVAKQATVMGNEMALQLPLVPAQDALAFVQDTVWGTCSVGNRHHRWWPYPLLTPARWRHCKEVGIGRICPSSEA